MKRLRHELVKGISVLAVFFCLIVSVSLVSPYSISPSEYTSVDFRMLAERPLLFEGKKVTSSASITEGFRQDSYNMANTTDGVLLVLPSSSIPPEKGDHLVFRGTSWILSNNSIYVQDFHVHQTYSSITRSAPGIVLFIVLFFTLFMIDSDRLAFVVRR